MLRTYYGCMFDYGCQILVSIGLLEKSVLCVRVCVRTRVCFHSTTPKSKEILLLLLLKNKMLMDSGLEIPVLKGEQTTAHLYAKSFRPYNVEHIILLESPYNQ